MPYPTRDPSDPYALAPSRPAPAPPSFPRAAPGGAELYGGELPGSPTAAYSPRLGGASGTLHPSPSMSPTGTNATSIVRKGYVSVKEDGLRSWIWSKRWLILREGALSVHKNDVRWLYALRCHSRAFCVSQLMTEAACDRRLRQP